MARVPALPAPDGYYPLKIARDYYILLFVSQNDKGDVTELETAQNDGVAVRFRTKQLAVRGAIELEQQHRAAREANMRQRIRELEEALRRTQKGVS